jgi:hypothetical protein
MEHKYVISGKLIRVCEKYYHTTEGIFNKAWYRSNKKNIDKGE